MRFSTSFTLATIAVAASSAKAQSCTQKGEIMCGESNTSLLLECDGENWSTQTCGADQYCMTMNPGMIHCMLKPDNEDHSSSHETDSITSSAWSLIANGVAAVALAAAGLSAFF
ncbi:hypothetical protein LPJ78_003270 [Coemansia sp. RSA 989]|nr:hypothetical protein BX667DRAFT_514059 [Coemansia mojavensis]KAJ1741740.1 hypothetical protein LPJ68_002536 [Coemansia sp. RSA 1086]KAJ1748710.1 hypothetical protein LPJ79_004301 [Coemansia sp. RSA 1821]KAJ1864615.1 hypothetical protein LPJ78_003270 [Coemansia sp. RSA 989]KAJ1872029.1 hypothetical protein LPJ55_003402 [Coemansia sp. RSA 990]KAJ2629189.1 hypothetical protein H4R22_003472 [Coemansia sp. RSA 1290]KAJ2647297.1 hypothetical protein IWW40_004772 [Coemansia sp. RSA 1250]KAJ26709